MVEERRVNSEQAARRERSLAQRLSESMAALWPDDPRVRIGESRTRTAYVLMVALIE